MSLFEDGSYVYRDTFFVFFQPENRPSSDKVQACFAELGKKYQIENIKIEHGDFESITIKSPYDSSAMDIAYVEGEEVTGQVLDMMEEIAQGTEVGKILGNGPVAVGKYFNHPRVPTVKNQSIAAYDPRAMQGNGVTYATSPMGADHTAGNLIASYLGGKLNPLAKEGQVHESKEIQIAMAFLDCTGLCLFAAGAMEKMEGAQALINMINAMLGTRLSIIDILYIGKRILKNKKDYNAKAGLTNKDDRLAEFFYKEPLPPHNKVFEIGSYELDAIFD